jgi:hypothetical protein
MIGWPACFLSAAQEKPGFGRVFLSLGKALGEPWVIVTSPQWPFPDQWLQLTQEKKYVK